LKHVVVVNVAVVLELRVLEVDVECVMVRYETVLPVTEDAVDEELSVELLIEVLVELLTEEVEEVVRVHVRVVTVLVLFEVIVSVEQKPHVLSHTPE
jgi:hypothetical protein